MCACKLSKVVLQLCACNVTYLSPDSIVNKQKKNAYYRVDVHVKCKNFLQ